MDLSCLLFYFVSDLFWKGFSQNWIFLVIPKKQACFLHGVFQVVSIHIPVDLGAKGLDKMGDDFFFRTCEGIETNKDQLLIWLGNLRGMLGHLTVELPRIGHSCRP